MASPFGSIFDFLGKPAALRVQEAEIAEKARKDEEARMLAQSQAQFQARGLRQAGAGIQPGMDVQNALKSVLSNKELMTDYLVHGGGDVAKLLDLAQRGGVNPSEGTQTLEATEALRQQQAASRAKGQARIAAELDKGKKPDQVYRTLVKDPVFMKDYSEFGGGTEEDLKNDIALGTTEPPKLEGRAPNESVYDETDPNNIKLVYKADAAPDHGTEAERAAEDFIKLNPGIPEETQTALRRHFANIRAGGLQKTTTRDPISREVTEGTEDTTKSILQQGGQPGFQPGAPDPTQGGSIPVPREQQSAVQPGQLPKPKQPPVNPAGPKTINVPPKYARVLMDTEALLGLPTGLLARQASRESGFDPDARGLDGEQGIMQIKPSTGRAAGLTDPFDAKKSIAAAGLIMSRHIKKYRGNVAHALAAYNWGEGNVDAWLKHDKGNPRYLPKDVHDYILEVLGPEGKTKALFPDVPYTGEQPQLRGEQGSEQFPMVESSKRLRTSIPDAAFGTGINPSVGAFFNNYVVATGLAVTDVDVQSAREASSHLETLVLRYLDKSGKQTGDERKRILEKLPRQGIRGVLTTPSSYLRKIIELRGIIEDDVNSAGDRLNQLEHREISLPPAVVDRLVETQIDGEIVINALGPVKELGDALRKAEHLEKNPQVKKDLMKRMDQLFGEGSALGEMFEGEEKLSLPERRKRAQEKLDALEKSRGTSEPVESTVSPEGEEDERSYLEMGTDKLKKLIEPEPTRSREDVLQRLRELEKKRKGTSLGDGTFVSPAGTELVPGKEEGTVVSAEERDQEEEKQLRQELVSIGEEENRQIRSERAKIFALDASEKTGIPEQAFHAAIGVQSAISEALDIPFSAVRGAMIAVGARRLMSPEWQSDRSTEDVLREHLTKQGYVVDIPDGSFSGIVGKGGAEGAMLALGAAALGTRLLAMKGPKAVKFITDKVGKLLAGTKLGTAAVTGASVGGTSKAVGWAAKKMGASETVADAAEIATGIALPGSGTTRTVSRVAKDLFKRGTPIQKPFRTPNAPAAERVKEIGAQLHSKLSAATQKKKTTLTKHLKQDADAAFDSIFGSNNPHGKMVSLMSSLARGGKEAREAVQHATMDWLFRKAKVRSPKFKPDNLEVLLSATESPKIRRALIASLGQKTVDRLDELVKSEIALSNRPSIKSEVGKIVALAGTGVGTPAAVQKAFSLAGRFFGAGIARRLGAKTIQATGVGAETGRTMFERVYQRMFQNIPAEELLRQALLDPKWEKMVIDQAVRLAREPGMGRTMGAGIGTMEALSDDDFE